MYKHILCVVVCIAMASFSFAADKYVDANASGANNGTSWADAWTSMATAMTNAAANDTINVAEGTYVAPSGGWAPTNSPLTLVAKTGDEVILSGDTNGDDTFADLLADPCALSAAYMTGDHSDNVQILNLSSKNLTVTGVTLSGGTNSSDGGAVSISGSSVVTFNNCLFTQCYSDGGGGVIKTTSTGTTTLNDCRLIQNSSNGRGSIMYAYSAGTIVANNCLFQISIAIDDGGGFNLRRYPLNCSFTDCIFDRCQMCNNSGGSAGIMTSYRSSTTLTLTNCAFIECQSYHHGAAAYVMTDASAVDVTANISNCLVTGCTNYEPAGTAVAFQGEVRTADSEVVVNLTNCTVADNHTNGQGHIGGWVYGNDATSMVDINLKNCIVWGNTGGAGNAQIINDTAAAGYPRVFINADYSCWDNSDPNDWGNAQSLGTGNLLKTADASLDPGFEAGLLSAYALSSSSPCIDTGDPTSDYSAEPKCNGGRINMGAYGGTAYATPTASSTKLADLDCDNNVDLDDFTILSGQWLQ